MIQRLQHAVLVRHAHAEWPGYTGADFDRPLTAQGLSDAAAAAEAIRAAGHHPDLLLTSPARRTLQTSEIIATTLALPARAVTTVDALYNASAYILESELRKALRLADTVMVVAHNPGISGLARMLTGNPDRPALRPSHWLHVHRPGD